MCFRPLNAFLSPVMPYIRRNDPQQSFQKLLLNIAECAVVIGMTMAFAYFLWRSRR
jgi:hypothetical protein